MRLAQIIVLIHLKEISSSYSSYPSHLDLGLQFGPRLQETQVLLNRPKRTP